MVDVVESVNFACFKESPSIEFEFATSLRGRVVRANSR